MSHLSFAAYTRFFYDVWDESIIVIHVVHLLDSYVLLVNIIRFDNIFKYKFLSHILTFLFVSSALPSWSDLGVTFWRRPGSFSSLLS